ncbi:MAG TPA: putative glycoside hydrolase [Gaiellaceae bacterium]|nr:putative glycoside hydrolase [Gaiellaceae bacterium]
MVATALLALALLAQPPTVRVWDDQLASNLTSAQVRFVATHEAGSQKLTRPQIDALKAINPHFRVLQYRLGIGLGRHTQIIDGSRWVPEWPARVQSQWFYEFNGKREYMKQWGWHLMDTNNRSWRLFFTKQLKRQVADTGAWGVFLDSSSVPNEFGGSAWFPPLPDLDLPFEHAWSARLARWLPYVQRTVRKPVVANVGSWVTTRDKTSYAHIAGVMIEGFGAGYAPADWLLQQRRALSVSTPGRILIAQSYPKTAADRLFDVASYLLVQGPQSYVNIETSMQAEWWPEYDVDLGRPLGTTHYGAYAWRNFEKGRVFVNASDTPQTVPANGKLLVFHGGGLVSSDGSTSTRITTRYVTELKLAPHTAAIVYA